MAPSQSPSKKETQTPKRPPKQTQRHPQSALPKHPRAVNAPRRTTTTSKSPNSGPSSASAPFREAVSARISSSASTKRTAVQYLPMADFRQGAAAEHFAGAHGPAPAIAEHRRLMESKDPMDVLMSARGPVYDEQGFELDYEAIRKCSHRPRPLSNKELEKEMEEGKRRHERKLEIFKLARWDLPYDVDWCMLERIAKELGKQYHEVGMDALEEWNRRGFSLEPDFAQKLSEADKKGRKRS
ncbi:hypothetical protein MMC13_004387 [Lambiella insularis]|nr:hypothetical protein [Lambiella insularis]